MQITVTIPQELETVLVQQAVIAGQDANSYVSQFLAAHLNKALPEAKRDSVRNGTAEARGTTKQPLKSSYGLCADLNVAISKEELDEARREMWANFPREKFFEAENEQ